MTLRKKFVNVWLFVNPDGSQHTVEGPYAPDNWKLNAQTVDQIRVIFKFQHGINDQGIEGKVSLLDMNIYMSIKPTRAQEDFLGNLHEYIMDWKYVTPDYLFTDFMEKMTLFVLCPTGRVHKSWNSYVALHVLEHYGCFRPITDVTSYKQVKHCRVLSFKTQDAFAELDDMTLAPERIAELHQMCVKEGEYYLPFMQHFIARHPNCPVDLLNVMFYHYWEDIMLNPVLPLLLLEHPDFLDDVVKRDFMTEVLTGIAPPSAYKMVIVNTLLLKIKDEEMRNRVRTILTERYLI